MFFCLGESITEWVLGIRSRFFNEVLCRHFLDLDANLKLTGFQLALLGFEHLSLGLHCVLLKILLIGKDLGDISNKVRHAAGFSGENFFHFTESLQGLLLICHRIGRLGLGNLLNGSSHVCDGFTLKEGELRPAKFTQGLFVHSFFPCFDESLEKLSVAIDDSLLGSAQPSLVHLGGVFICVCLDAPLLGLALHELLGFDNLPDLLDEEVVDENGVGAGDDLAKFFHDFLDRFSCFREMRVGDFWFAGLEFLTSVREFIASSYDFLGAESSESISCFAKSCGIALLAESVRLQIFKEEAEASHD